MECCSISCVDLNSWTNIVYVSFFNVKIWYIILHIIGKKDKVNTSMEFVYQPKFSGKQLLRKLHLQVSKSNAW